MNPTLTTWFQLLGLIAVEVAVIVGIAAQLQRLTRSAIWRRTIWQACILSLLLLVAFELTGVARNVVGWIGQKPVATTPIPSRTASANTGNPTSKTDARSSPSLRSAAESRRDPVTIGDNESGRLERTPLPNPLSFVRGEGTEDTAISHPTASSITGHVAPAPQGHVAAQPPFTQHAKRDTQQAKLPRIMAASESLFVLWLGLVWMVGAGVVIGRVLVSRTVLEIFRWQRKGIENVELHESVQALALLLGIRRRVRLMESARIPAPVAFGILRPTIGLPPQFGVKFNSVQQEAMLAHDSLIWREMIPPGTCWPMSSPPLSGGIR